VFGSFNFITSREALFLMLGVVLIGTANAVWGIKLWRISGCTFWM
jgi:hypothetical protein